MLGKDNCRGGLSDSERRVAWALLTESTRNVVTPSNSPAANALWLTRPHKGSTHLRMSVETVAQHRDRLRYEAGLREVFGELSPLPTKVYTVPDLGAATDALSSDTLGISAQHAAAADRVVCVLAHLRGVTYAPQLPALVQILLTALPEQDAFASADALVKSSASNTGIGGILFTTRAAEESFVHAFLALCAQQFPKTSAHMEAVLGHEGCRALAASWFRGLFVGWLPLPDCAAVLDAFLWEGPKVLMRLGLALLKHTKHAIKAERSAPEMVALIRGWLSGTPLARPLAHLGASSDTPGAGAYADSPAGDGRGAVSSTGSISAGGGPTMQRYCFAELRQTAFYAFPRLSRAAISSALSAYAAHLGQASGSESVEIPSLSAVLGPAAEGGTRHDAVRAGNAVLRSAPGLAASAFASPRGVHVGLVASLHEGGEGRPTISVRRSSSPSLPQPGLRAPQPRYGDADRTPSSGAGAASSSSPWYSKKVVGMGCRLLAPAVASGSVFPPSDGSAPLDPSRSWPYDIVEAPHLRHAMTQAEARLTSSDPALRGLFDPAVPLHDQQHELTSTGLDVTDAGDGYDDDATCGPESSGCRDVEAGRAPSPIPSLAALSINSGTGNGGGGASHVPPFLWALCQSPFTASLSTMLPLRVSHHHLAPVYSTDVHGWGLQTAYGRCAGLAPLLVTVQLAVKGLPHRPVVGFYSSFGLPTSAPDAGSGSSSGSFSRGGSYASMGGVTSVSNQAGNQGTGWIGSAADFMFALQPSTAFFECVPLPPAAAAAGEDAPSSDAEAQPSASGSHPQPAPPFTVHRSHFVLAARQMLVVGGDPARAGSAALRISGDLHTAAASMGLLAAIGALPPSAAGGAGSRGAHQQQQPPLHHHAHDEEQCEVHGFEVYAFADRGGTFLTDGNVAAASESKAAWLRSLERYWARGHAAHQPPAGGSGPGTPTSVGGGRRVGSPLTAGLGLGGTPSRSASPFVDRDDR